MNRVNTPRSFLVPIRLRRFVGPREIIRIDCGVKCNVLVLDDANYRKYANLRPYEYEGGFFDSFPVWVRPPYAGDWNVILDMGGADATTGYSIVVIDDPHDPAASGFSDVIESS